MTLWLNRSYKRIRKWICDKWLFHSLTHVKYSFPRIHYKNYPYFWCKPLIIKFKFLNKHVNIFFALDDRKLWSDLVDFKKTKEVILKGVFATNERGYRLNAIKKRFWSLLILLLSVASIRRKLLKTTNTEEHSVHTNSERCNIQLGS